MRKMESDETIINGSRVLIDENGEVETISNESNQRTGYMTVEELYQLVDEGIKSIYSTD